VLWYNKNSWIVWKHKYKRIILAPPGVYYLYSRLIIDNIVY
jgi:hypothetical protein